MSEQEQLVAETLPCPFCGTPDPAIRNADDGLTFYIACSSVECSAVMGEAYDFSSKNIARERHMFNSQEDAIAAWNRRAP